ncbi:hypothetical protein [Chitinophaga silvisoli]|uniref:Abortive infection protein-like C-terminal domain-containing protein n=1 Tax=Chitinophaga silvisoli TaxID=2291814 RepID=A0A3E1PA30_9BACT|nr:hypothetical protein [Chitinophaga silvisoli]RFM37039.1 hypothetical protein DXN04_05945 [Chitinophaga silvisoli]
MLKKFYETFNIKSSEDQGRAEFLNRLFFFLDEASSFNDRYIYSNIFKGVCFELGLNPATFEQPQLTGPARYPDLQTLAKGDFHEAMKVTCALYHYFKRIGESVNCYEIDVAISHIIGLSTTDIGVRWVDGFFYPNNIPEIDYAVVDETLSWLSDFPAAKKDMQNAFSNFSSGKTEQVLSPCYMALENVIHMKTGLKSPLHENKLQEALFKNMLVSDSWRQFLVKFVQYANDFGRHGRNPDRHSVDNAEVESFLYLSCIMLRMIIRKIPN